jgi:hypothetical protein
MQTRRAELRAATDAKVLEAIRSYEESGDTWTTNQIARDCGLEWMQVMRALSRLVMAGRVRACRPRAPFETVQP